MTSVGTALRILTVFLASGFLRSPLSGNDGPQIRLALRGLRLSALTRFPTPRRGTPGSNTLPLVLSVLRGACTLSLLPSPGSRGNLGPSREKLLQGCRLQEV
ncbi:hypothetical protein DPX16_4608 [Anabarilius grahami]|uniref:Uncharacterized protein n=1 Tax=Anabarilius grahami TaxID=495550 RepID=A0A3N0YCE6_ANAGA|nr:hypothetical protein DPX16_4608 [Anabarilius grahami]